jgi:predicted RNase H-like HicB family nuclease
MALNRPDRSDFSFAPSMHVEQGHSMRSIKFCVYKEPPYYVAQCLNGDVSSFGETVDEAIGNLKEAVELQFEDEPADDYRTVGEVLEGESMVNA